MAAHMPAIKRSIIGFGNKKYATQENNGMAKAMICIKKFLVPAFSKTNPIAIK